MSKRLRSISSIRNHFFQAVEKSVVAACLEEMPYINQGDGYMEIQSDNYFWSRLRNKCICSVLAGLCLPAFGTAQAYDDYQYRMLLNPSEEMLEAEKRGYIMIYDGLQDRVVEQAMTLQFDRIENMMFVGTKHLQEDGELLFEEDGCD